MRHRQSYEAVYMFRVRRPGRPLLLLLALFCMAAGMSAGAYSQLGRASSGYGTEWRRGPRPTGAAWTGHEGSGELTAEPAALEVTFMLPDPGPGPDSDPGQGLSVDSDVRSLSPDPGSADDLPAYQAASRTRMDESESRGVSFVWPVEGKVTDAFGWRTHPITGKSQFHKGIDIAAPTGTPVRAVAAGTAEFTGWSEGYGRIVIISHGEECRTKYGHLSGYAVSSGQKVARGEIIGYVGESGNAIGPHCHFEVEIGGSAVDPKDYLP